MTARKLYALILLLAAAHTALAQKENYVWTMGYYGLGLDFNTGSPVFFTNSCNTREGAASVADPAGKLLFYCDGTRAYDRTDAVMLNGSGLLGDESTTQGVAIAQVKGHDSLYLLFTLSSEGGDLNYSVVNMKLNGGLGGIVSTEKNTFVAHDLSEKMIVAGGCERQWLLVHHADSGYFYAYQLTGTTLPPPVVSKVGPLKPSVWYYIFGEMKISPDRKTLALANSFGSALELYDFDQATGMVSNRRALDTSAIPTEDKRFYGVEFSADNQLLYASCASSGAYGFIDQYNLAAGSLAAIRSSVYRVITGSAWGMRRGPDDREIYVINSALNFSRIRNPTVTGAGCNFQYNFLPDPFPMPTHCLTFGNYFIPVNRDTIGYASALLSYCGPDSITIDRTGFGTALWNDGYKGNMRRVPPVDTVYWLTRLEDCVMRIDTVRLRQQAPIYSSRLIDTNICRDTFMLQARSTADSVKWFDGDTRMTKILGGSGGRYWVRSYMSDCTVRTDTFHVVKVPLDSVRNTIDTTFCLVAAALVRAPDGYDDYLWSGGGTSQDTTIADDAAFGLRAVDYKGCRVLDIAYKAAFISYDHPLSDRVICNSDTVSLDARVLYPDVSYKWNTGQETPQIRVDKAGAYTVLIHAGVCALTDTVEVQQKTLHVRIDGTGTGCMGKAVVLSASEAGAAYQWSSGQQSQEIETTDSGRYTVLVSSGGCVDSAAFELRFVNCDNCVFLPNAFTPGKDGRNDYFMPLINCPVLRYKLTIYNRWGQQVFAADQPAEGWDGTFKGRDMELGSYYYLLRVTFEAQSRETVLKGDVMLIR